MKPREAYNTLLEVKRLMAEGVHDVDALSRVIRYLDEVATRQALSGDETTVTIDGPTKGMMSEHRKAVMLKRDVIRQMYETTGYTHQQLADMYQVSKSFICHALDLSTSDLIHRKG